MSEVVWTPDAGDDRARERDAARAPARASRTTASSSAARQDDPAWFWPLAIEDMGLEFSRPWEQVLDDSRGPEWTTWFLGGDGLDRPQLRPPLGRADARRARRRRARRGRLAAHAHLRRALARGDAARRGARRGSASSRATASRSSCRCRPRSRSPRTRSRTSARSRCRSSPASPRPPSRSGCRRARRRS